MLDRIRKAGYRLAPGLMSAGLAAGPVALFWGFSVDDALIVTRIVEVAKSTGTFSLNRGEPAVDAVTPLGFAPLLLGVVRATGLDAFSAARFLGVASFIAAYGLAGLAAARHGPRAIGVMGALAASAVTGGAWAGAGLETPGIALIATLGFFLMDRSRAWGACWLGAAAALRPDLTLVALLVPQLERRKMSSHIRLGVLTLLPIVAVMGVRWILFGDVLPLGFRAKPADFSSGLRYACGALLLSGPFWLLIAARGPLARRLALLIFIHFLSLLLAGGDWMPLFRLSCPLLPWIGVLGARAMAGGVAPTVALALSLAGPTVLTLAYREDSSRVVETRRAMIAAACRELDGSKRTASVDIGWLSIATPGSVVDLSGVANRRVARLPGGHTSHHVQLAYLDHERVDTWVVRVADEPASPGESSENLPPARRAVYAADRRLLRGAAELGFAQTGLIPIPRTHSSYAILRRSVEPVAAELKPTWSCPLVP